MTPRETSGGTQALRERHSAGPAAGRVDPGSAPAAAAPIAPKPWLRGSIHAATAPIALAAVAAGIFAASAVVLFTVSALYHLGAWSPRPRVILRRIDHANILFLIAV